MNLDSWTGSLRRRSGSATSARRHTAAGSQFAGGATDGAAAAQETYAYAKTMLDVATAGADGRGRALIVGGGISNFTDVASTFKGIIQVRAWDTRC